MQEVVFCIFRSRSFMSLHFFGSSFSGSELSVCHWCFKHDGTKLTWQNRRWS